MSELNQTRRLISSSPSRLNPCQAASDQKKNDINARTNKMSEHHSLGRSIKRRRFVHYLCGGPFRFSRWAWR